MAGLPLSRLRPRHVATEGNGPQLALVERGGQGRHQGFDPHALFPHFPQFFSVGRHLPLAAPVHDAHAGVGSQQTPGRAGAVDGRKPAPDDDHIALDRQRRPIVKAFHEPQALVAQALRQAFQFEQPRLIGPRGQQHRIVLCPQRGELRGIDLRAAIRRRMPLWMIAAMSSSRTARGQAERGNADADLAAEVRFAFEDRHVMPIAPQFPGRGQAGRPPPTIATRLPLSS